MAAGGGIGGEAGLEDLALENDFVNLATEERTTHILYGDGKGGGHLYRYDTKDRIISGTWPDQYGVYADRTPTYDDAGNLLTGGTGDSVYHLRWREPHLFRPFWRRDHYRVHL